MPVFIYRKTVEEKVEDDEKTKKLRWMHYQQQMHRLSWNEEGDDDGGVGLKIIVLENMFSLEETQRMNSVGLVSNCCRGWIYYGIEKRRSSRL